MVSGAGVMGQDLVSNTGRDVPMGNQREEVLLSNSSVMAGRIKLEQEDTIQFVNNCQCQVSNYHLYANKQKVAYYVQINLGEWSYKLEILCRPIGLIIKLQKIPNYRISDL